MSLNKLRKKGYVDFLFKKYASKDVALNGWVSGLPPVDIHNRVN